MRSNYFFGKFAIDTNVSAYTDDIAIAWSGCIEKEVLHLSSYIWMMFLLVTPWTSDCCLDWTNIISGSNV